MSMERFAGCMLGSGVGDALGASFEGVWEKTLRIEDLRFGGRWTDDTAMMIGVAESLIAKHGFNSKHMAEMFRQNWEKAPWRGYGPGPPAVFRMVRRGVSWSEAAGRLYGGAGSYGNGAAMRVAPIGLLYHTNKDKLKEIAYKSAEITHTHELGKEGAAVQAYAVALAIQTERGRIDAREFLEKLISFTENRVFREKLKSAKTLLNKDEKRAVIRRLGNTVEAFNSVPTAIYCFTKNSQNYATAVTNAILLGGDTDTIGAMTGAIAGAYHGEAALPQQWTQKLEKKRYINGLAHKLWHLWDLRGKD